MSIVSVFPGGSGAKINIKACATIGGLPATAKEGDLSVITATAIHDVYASQDMPSAPSNGDVWVWLGSNARVEMDLGKNIYLPPRACFQYNGTTWIYKESYVYHSAVWVEVTLYLYLDGSMLLFNGYSGVNYGGNNYSAVAITLENTFIKYLCTGITDREERFAWSENTIDLTDIDSIICDYDICGTIDKANLMVSLTRGKTPVAQVVGSVTAGSHTAILDVSGLSGYYYIGMYGGRFYTGAANVDQISINSFYWQGVDEMYIYLDADFMAHTQQNEEASRTPWEDTDGFFTAKCPAFIEGHRVVPEGKHGYVLMVRPLRG